MSHFATLVLLKDLDNLTDAMQPYHEFECTGEDDQYVVDVEVSASSAEDCEYKRLTEGEQPGPTHKYGYIRADGVAIKRTNPNSRWDWWTVGGRWSDALPGNAAQVKDIDWAKLERQARTKTAASLNQILHRHGVTRDEFDALWEAHVAAYPAMRQEHEASYPKPAFSVWIDRLPDTHPCKRYYRSEVGREIGWRLSLNEEFPTVDAWIASKPALPCFALLHDNVWEEQGRMGWFGVAHNEKPDVEWAKHVKQTIQAQDPETWVVVVDCHI